MKFLKQQHFLFACTRSMLSLCMIVIISIAVYGRRTTIFTDAPVTGENTQMRKVVALTFDDGPHEKITPQILEILRKKDAQATFFVMGEKVKEYPTLAKKIIKEGHEIGTHTFSHVDLSQLSKRQAEKEIMRTQKVIRRKTGRNAIFLRPPFGKIREDEIPKALVVVSWNVDTLDWTGVSVESILKKVRKECRPGSIILMHDQYENTAKALPYIIDWLREENYDIISVEELLFGD